MLNQLRHIHCNGINYIWSFPNRLISHTFLWGYYPKDIKWIIFTYTSHFSSRISDKRFYGYYLRIIQGVFFLARLKVTWSCRKSVYVLALSLSLALSLLALQPLSGVVFYSSLAGFSLLACEVSWSHITKRHSR